MEKNIGITTNPEQRWQNGRGYAKQRFGQAIKKYGWEKFKHEILFSNLTKKKAEQTEIELIKLHKTNNPIFGYNVSDNEGGGRPKTHDTPEEAEEAKKKSDNKSRKKYNDKINSNPVLKKKAIKNQKQSKAKYNAKKTPEQIREYNRIAKQKERAKKKTPSKVNTIPCKTDFVNQFKENQLKIVCEIAGEQKN